MLEDIKPLAFTWVYLNGTLFIGHPAERLKVAVQLNLSQPSWQTMKPLLTYSSGRTLYTGFPTCFLRQNFKYSYRTLNMLVVPNEVDAYQFNLVTGSAIKAGISCSIDTLATTPFENVKTYQMKATFDKLTMALAVKQITAERGISGFFAGASATAGKSFPSWFYLFLGYEATKDKREKTNFLQTIFWATMTAVPITVTTNPLDVIKTQQQARLIPVSEKGLLNAAKFIAKEHGLFAFSKGISCRLTHKSLATAAGYTIIDLCNQARPK